MIYLVMGYPKSSTVKTARGKKLWPWSPKSLALASKSLPLVTCNKCALCKETKTMLTFSVFTVRPITGLEVQVEILKTSMFV